MINVAAILYGAQSAVRVLGVNAELSTGSIVATLRVHDDTQRWTDVEGNAAVQTVKPGAYAYMVDLIANGLTPNDCIDGTLTFNGRSWLVQSFEMRGSPQGRTPARCGSF